MLCVILTSLIFSVSLFVCLFVYSVSRGGPKRGGERESQAVSALTEGLNSMNSEITTLAKIKSWMFNQLSHPGALTGTFFFFFFFFFVSVGM